ncbi:hypothetical protein [Trinickia sp. Y13]|uniref:hypothetical protein n=1 Tax=Trinickia sp. Y13 TaxID=2917807 RepID=UPI00240774C8|nr:hypothetical protein [Trinickia sp. Y13]MDG0025442.1 hypothetical protein [Trinickia sp. Y13]
MSMIAVDDERVHLRVWEMLPWVVNGRADASELRRVNEHLRGCALCLSELSRQRDLRSIMNGREPQAPRVESGLTKLLQRIADAEVDAQAHRVSALRQPQAAANARSGVAAALACALAAVVLLQSGARAVLDERLRAEPAAVYRTLSEPVARPDRAAIRLVVDERMSVHDLQTLLISRNLQIVAGPDASGIYSLAPLGATASLDAVAAALRAAPGVRFAEPVAQAPSGP